jgi:hypothetical protein
MALTNIVSGELRNKVGAMVGAKWKGKTYVRAYVKPKDANTDAQKAVRGQFKKVTAFGSAINDGVLKMFQAKPVKNQSPYNRFVQINKELMGDDSLGYENIKIFNGHLPTASNFSASASAAAQSIEVTCTPQHYGIAKDDDTLIAIAYDETADTFGYGITPRGSGTSPLTITVPGYFEAGDTIHVYLSACQKKVDNGATLHTSITAVA